MQEEEMMYTEGGGYWYRKGQGFIDFWLDGNQTNSLLAIAGAMGSLFAGVMGGMASSKIAAAIATAAATYVVLIAIYNANNSGVTIELNIGTLVPLVFDNDSAGVRAMSGWILK
jgi:hypothetical protein